YETPRSTFVANFLGTSNLVPGTVDDATPGGDVALTSRGTRLLVPAARCAAPPRVGGALLLGVRPEKV
ncbi:ABC transporter ATP-binding protein, partial [Streptomyces sp. SID11233]|nr:ABC transporter ATP-binding protein [Streptomyces sp. SID11233]